jgi:hypothetical protein
LKVTDTEDPEIKLQWFPLCITLGYTKVLPNAKKWVGSQGRMKYINPVYAALMKSGMR